MDRFTLSAVESRLTRLLEQCASAKRAAYRAACEYDAVESLQGEIVSLAEHMIRVDYMADVESYAAELIAEHGPDVDAITDRISEVVDGSSWIIYTAQNARVLQASDQDAADLASGMGLEHPTTVQLAYCAMEADVRDKLADHFQEAEQHNLYHDATDRDLFEEGCSCCMWAAHEAALKLDKTGGREE